MIFLFTFLIIFLQSFLNLIFLFLLPVLDYFFENNIKKLIFSLIILSLLTDLVFLKPFGFFLALTSFCLIIVSLLEKFVSSDFFYQKLIYFIIFNVLFLILFFYFSYNFLFVSLNFLKILFLNLIFQFFYFFSKRLLSYK